MGIGFESKKKSSKSTVAVCLNLMIDIGETATAVVVSCLFGVNFVPTRYNTFSTMREKTERPLFQLFIQYNSSHAKHVNTQIMSDAKGVMPISSDNILT